MDKYFKQETQHPNGELRTQYQFLNDDKHGIQLEFDTNGKLQY